MIAILSSCASEEEAVTITPTPAPDPVIVEEVVDEEEMPSPILEEGPRTVVGSFRSVKGVMDPLSCYCGNSGYVESPAGEVVPVCFDNNVNVSSTDYIEVTGVMTTRTIDDNGACPSGTSSYLIVESYQLTP